MGAVNHATVDGSPLCGRPGTVSPGGVTCALCLEVLEGELSKPATDSVAITVRRYGLSFIADAYAVDEDGAAHSLAEPWGMTVPEVLRNLADVLEKRSRIQPAAWAQLEVTL